MGKESKIKDDQRGLSKERSAKPASGKVQELSRDTHNNGVSSSTEVVYFLFSIPSIEKKDIEKNEIKKIQLETVFGKAIVKDKGFNAMLAELQTGTLFHKNENNYLLTNLFFKKYEVLPKLKPTKKFTKEGDLKIIDTVSKIGQTVDLIANVNELLAEDQIAILKDRVGSILNYKYWDKVDKSFFSYDIKADMNEVITLLNNLDDEAINSMFADLTLNKRGSAWQKSTPLIIHMRLLDLKSKLMGLKELSDSRAISSKNKVLDLAMADTALFGYSELFFAIKERNSITKTIEPAIDMKLKPRTYYTTQDEVRRAALATKIEMLYQKLGIDESAFKKVQKSFVSKFEEKTKDFALRALNKQLRLLVFERKKGYSVGLGSSIKSAANKLFNIEKFNSYEGVLEYFNQLNATIQNLTERYPIIKYVNFWKIYSKSFNSNKDFSKGLFNVQINKTIDANNELLKKFKDKSNIWDADILIKNSIQNQNIISKSPHDHNAMLLYLIHEKQRNENRLKPWEIVLIGLAIVLSFAGPVGMIAAVGIGVFEVYRMVEDQAYAKKLHISGYSSKSPPSDWWILLAVAGVGLDVGSFVKALSVVKKTPQLIKSADDIDQLVEMKIIKDAKIANNLKHKLKIKDQLGGAISDFRKTSMALGSLNSAANEFSSVAYYLAKLGFVKFEHFILELARHKLLDKIGESDSLAKIIKTLSPEDLKYLKKKHLKAIEGIKLSGSLGEAGLTSSKMTLFTPSSSSIKKLSPKLLKEIEDTLGIDGLEYLMMRGFKMTLHKTNIDIIDDTGRMLCRGSSKELREFIRYHRMPINKKIEWLESSKTNFLHAKYTYDPNETAKLFGIHIPASKPPKGSGLSPDFRYSEEFLYLGDLQYGRVKLTMSGSRDVDFQILNDRFGFPSTPSEYVWHHLDEVWVSNSGELVCTMQLVRKEVHKKLIVSSLKGQIQSLDDIVAAGEHIGSVAIWKAFYLGVKYK